MEDIVFTTVGATDQRRVPPAQASSLATKVISEWSDAQLVGESIALKRVLKQIEIVAATDAAVLICGETGTGKDLIARMVHRLSFRRGQPLVVADCASIPAGLLESELFGHEKGAFTGAIARNIGRFELADKGTLFLDEVGNIPLELQSKLLRVLQEQELERLGSTRTVRLDFRLVAATNRNLKALVGQAMFRSDLYYRLKVFPIEVPALRDRVEDVPLLAWHFTRNYARHLNKKIDNIRAQDLEGMAHYSWPGNVRELQHLIERSVILSCDGVLDSTAFAELTQFAKNPSQEVRTLAEAERAHILEALRNTDWVIGGPYGAAVRLGVKRTTLLDKMRRHGIVRPQS
jgi:formate hydrogenlyase transcriptional activator